MSLAFNDIDLTERAFQNYENMMGDSKPVNKILVDCHWPVGGKSNNSKRLIDLADKHGWNYVRMIDNRGVTKNWSWVSDQLGLSDGDVLMGCDPDGKPMQPGYLDAIMNVFNSDPSYYTVQLNRACIYRMADIPKSERQINGTWVIDYHRLISWSLGAFDIGWIKRIGGFDQYSKWYSYFEHYVSDRATPLGGRFAILRDFYDEHQATPNPKYQAWKLASAEKRTELDFATWLTQNP